MNSAPGTIITDRGGIVECRHQVYAVVVDGSGKLLLAMGDPSRVTLIRSAAKPAQALAILETGCIEQYTLSEQDLALICASHNSEDRHLARAQSILNRIGAKESDLRCGPHLPISKDVERAWIKRDFTPTAVCNNCSGKHAGMLAGAKALGAGFERYNMPDHAMQVRVRGAVEDLCQAKDGPIQWGIDGCNLPAPAMPLNLLAKVYAVFAAAADDSEGGNSSSRTQACARIFHAMSQHSELVAGEGRFCTELMTAYQGSLIGKVGAEACYAIGIRASEHTRRLGSTGPIGIAVKVEDGNMDVMYSAVAEILQQLEIGSADAREKLKRFRKRTVLNTAGVVVGSVTHDFALRPDIQSNGLGLGLGFGHT